MRLGLTEGEEKGAGRGKGWWGVSFSPVCPTGNGGWGVSLSPVCPTGKGRGRGERGGEG